MAPSSTQGSLQPSLTQNTGSRTSCQAHGAQVCPGPLPGSPLPLLTGRQALPLPQAAAAPPQACKAPSLPKFPPFPISVDRSAFENSLQEPEADSSRIFSLMSEPFLKLQKCTQP